MLFYILFEKEVRTYTMCTQGYVMQLCREAPRSSYSSPTRGVAVRVCYLKFFWGEANLISVNTAAWLAWPILPLMVHVLLGGKGAGTMGQQSSAGFAEKQALIVGLFAGLLSQAPPKSSECPTLSRSSPPATGALRGRRRWRSSRSCGWDEEAAA